MIITFLLYFLLAVISTLIIWKGSNLLEISSEKISVYYHLSPTVQGAIITAVGSSFPEFTTVIVSTILHGTFELGVSAIVGSAIFNILVIPGLSGLFSKTKLKISKELVYKETMFYIISVLILFLIFAFAYIYNPITVKGDSSLFGKITRPQALIAIIIYCFYIFLQFQDNIGYIPEYNPEKINIIKNWFLLIFSLTLIFIGVEGLVQSAIKFGEIFNTPDFLWGITVVAIGTSIPDAILSINFAKNNKAESSIANATGSNIFDLLICIPVGILIAGSTVINFTVASPLMLILIFISFIIFFMLRRNLDLTKNESLILLLLYIIFILWISLETFQLIDFTPGLPPK